MTELHQVACRGKNCGRTDETHSFECLEEHSLCAGHADFSAALRALKEGHKVARRGWNGKGLWVELQTPDERSKMTLPYLYINYPADAKTTPGARVPWFASQTDMLAEDWAIIG